jgi:mono/diheme cytochrome c family protein
MRTQPIVPPTGRQVVRQVIVLGLIGLVWLAGGAVVLSAVDLGADRVIVAEVDSGVTPVKRTAVPPTTTPTVAASPTSVPTTLAPTASASPTSAPTVSASTVSAPTVSAPTVSASTATTVPAIAAPTATATLAPKTPTAQSSTAAPTNTPVTTGGAVSYSRDVQSIFNQICVKCHGGDETKEGLSLKSYADVMAGSNNGPVITPGDAANSFLIQQVVNGKMPKQGPRLLPAQIRTLSDWVAAGALNN